MTTTQFLSVLSGLSAFWCILCIVSFFLPETTIQQRTYSLSVAGAGSGTYSQIITSRGRGGYTIETSASLHLKKLIYHYDYTFSSSESWKAGRYITSQSQRNDNGDNQAYNLAENKTDWTSSFWTLPPHLGDLKVFDLDSGTFAQCKLAYLGTDQFGEHYRLSGGLENELWFDKDNRLARRVFTRKGRLATISLDHVKE